MLSKRHRLSARAVARVKTKGKFWRGQTIFVRFAPSHNTYTRLVVVVPKKVYIKATKRNLLRRQIVNKLRADFINRTKGEDVVITINKAADPETIIQEIETWLKHSS